MCAKDELKVQPEGKGNIVFGANNPHHDPSASGQFVIGTQVHPLKVVTVNEIPIQTNSFWEIILNGERVLIPLFKVAQ